MRPTPAAAPTSSSADAPQRTLPGDDCIAVFIAAGGVVVLQEIRPDGRPGVELHVPPDEYTDDMPAAFARKIARKQARRLALVQT